MKLIDFGLAAFFDIGNEDQILAFAGTPSYMPPDPPPRPRGLGLHTAGKSRAVGGNRTWKSTATTSTPALVHFLRPCSSASNPRNRLSNNSLSESFVTKSSVSMCFIHIEKHN